MPERLLLVRHSLPERAPGRAPPEWPLCDEGRARAHALAESLAVYAPLEVFSSPEPKAQQTAEVIAQRHGTQVQVRAGLREHGPRTYEPSAARFQHEIERLLRDPGRQTSLAVETGREALARFEAAVSSSALSAGGTPCVVSHGTVITLLVASHNDIDPVAFWRDLAMPAVVELSANDLTLCPRA